MSVYSKSASDLIQKIIESRSSQQKTIELERGDYFLENPIQLDERDSGLTLTAAPGADVHLYGGKPVTAWQRKDDRLWFASLPAVKERSWDFRMLMVNGRLAERSRLPETGYFLHDTPFDVRWLSTVEGGWERPPTQEELLTLQYREGDIGSWFDVNNAELTIFHMWDESLVGVAELNESTRSLRFSNEPGYPPGAFSGQYDMERRYVIWNLEQGLHRPGQWYLDRSAGEVVYWPREDENPEDALIIAPTVENVICIDGKENQPVRNVTLQGLSISVANAPVKTGAFGAKLFDGAVSLKNTVDCSLLDLTIHGVAAHGVKAHGDRFTIKNCRIYDTGASAIRYTGGEGLIENNHIHHVGRLFPSAIAVYVGMTDPNVPEEWDIRTETHETRIVHNELHDTPYTAIACGGDGHKIENNLIYRAMQDLYDGAGIYVTFCQGVEIRGNFIRDIKDAAGAGTSAYYLDEHSIGCLVEENLEINVSRPMHNHISKSNVIRNNVFIMRGKGKYTLERSSDYTFEKNILIADEEFAIFDIRAIDHFSNNVFFSREGKIVTRELDLYTINKSYPLPLTGGNEIGDPELQDFETGHVRFREDSLPDKLGIKQIDVSRAGRRSG